MFEVKIEPESDDDIDDNRPRSYLCTVCDKWFVWKADLEVHKSIHTEVKSYSCTLCEKSFPIERYLKQHMVVHSSKYKCAECGKCFRSKEKLETHGRSHSGEKPFQCSVWETDVHDVRVTRRSQQNSQRKETVPMSHVRQGVRRLRKSDQSPESPHGRQTVQVFAVQRKFQRIQHPAQPQTVHSQQQETVQVPLLWETV